MLTDYNRITDFGNLYRSYRKSKSGKGYKKSNMKFQVCALDGIYQIKKSLVDKTYEVSPYNQFKIYEPKERVIKACSFKDKIVQHSLCDYVLHPLLEKEFILDNYAGQVGKGTLFGLNRLSSQMLQAYEKYGMNCWILKGDISKFFYTINHEILKDIVSYHVSDKETYWLCEKFIDSTDGIGIPLGNQVSQVFALLYLSGMDHFIKGDLGIELYGRYMDDFYLIFPDKAYLKQCLNDIKEYVKSLGLELNGKTQIVPFKNGIKFCGFHTYVTSDGKAIRKLKNENKRVAKKKYRKLVYQVREGKMTKEKFYEKYNAWRNHISHGNCIKLGYEMDRYIKSLLKDI